MENLIELNYSEKLTINGGCEVPDGAEGIGYRIGRALGNTIRLFKEIVSPFK